MTPPEPRKDERSGVGTGASECDEVSIVVSDMHLSEGLKITVQERLPVFTRMGRWILKLFGKKKNHPTVEIDNPLEDFHYDDEFDDFIDIVIEQYGQADTCRLRLLGDIFDPLAVSDKAKLAPAPYEHVAVRKMRRIAHGHSKFFDALARFLERPNCRIDIFVGNHDQFLVWPDVQKEIIERLAGLDEGAASRIRFVGQDVNFEETRRSVYYYHGMNAEPHNTVNAEDAILTHRFGQELKTPILNMPYASYMNINLVNRLKIRNRLVGRLRSESEIWSDAAKYRWGWGVYAFFALVWNFIHNQLFAFWDVRRKTSFKKTFLTVLATARKNPVDRYAKKVLQKRDDVRVVIMGHSHTWRRESSDAGTYINTGTWCLKYRFIEPEVEFRWGRLKRLELVWRSLLYFLETGKVTMYRQLTKLLGFIAAVAAMATFLFTSFPREEWGDWSVTMSDFKIPIGIMLAFFVLAGAFRIFAVKPRVVPDPKFTFALVRHYRNGDLKAELMEYAPEENAVRECI